jgi:hypothetical protein
MMSDPASIFGDDDELASPVMPRPDPEQVKALSEAANFRSREPAPSLRRPRRGKRRTGRTEQFACRLTPEAVEMFYRIADERGWTMGATVERALAALQAELQK